MARIDLDKLAGRVLYDKSAARRSQKWFDEQIKYLGHTVSPNSVMSNSKRHQNFLIPGQMVMFFYTAMNRKTLPYYDTFPLVIPFSDDGSTFTGINFHYLPPKYRATLLKNLLDFSTDKKLDEKTKLRLQWEFIAKSSRYRGVEFAVKKYRYDHVQSSFLFVPAQQWFNAVLLPFERFVMGEAATRMQKSRVWLESGTR